MSLCQKNTPMATGSAMARPDYTPPFLGNGRLATPIDFHGAQMANPLREGNGSVSSLAIWWAGRRYADSALIPFGRFEQRVGGGAEAKAWTQSLDPEHALLACDTQYAQGVRVETEAFFHHDLPLLAFRKRIACETATPFSFNYLLAAPESAAPPKGMQFTLQAERDKAEMTYLVEGQSDYNGKITVIVDGDWTVACENNRVVVSGDVLGEREMKLYLLLHDEEPDGDMDQRTAHIQRIRTEGYETLRAAHANAWAAYHAEGYIRLADESLDNTYRMAQYLLRCFATPWSIPVALCDASWQGRYFAFDEYHAFYGLLTANHTALAGRIPTFRHAGLEKAVKRATHKHTPCARYPWETNERGEDRTPSGFWMEHIFHMANVSLGAWQYYLYTGDEAFLREKGYPMLYACANFFLSHMLYRVADGRLIVGKCTDLERLGSSVENPYMTTCGVIATLRMCAEAAALLAVDASFAQECLSAADDLTLALPHEGGRYIPYPGCEERSIAVFSGLVPYRVLPEGDEKQQRAMADFLEHELTYGNMYAMGKGISSWYASWKAMAYARLRNSPEALRALRQTAASCGSFGEMFEINEEGCRLHPWFSTSAGFYMGALNAMFLDERTDGYLLLPAVPEELRSARARLRGSRGMVFEFAVNDGRLASLAVERAGATPVEEITVASPETYGVPDVIEGACVTARAAAPGEVVLTLRLAAAAGTPA